jgi:ATP-binding protein involved in chromosome partitioning
VPFLGEIPLEPRVRVGGDSGTPIVVAYPLSPVSQAFLRIADLIRAAT